MSNDTTVYLFIDAQCDTQTHRYHFVYFCVMALQNAPHFGVLGLRGGAYD